MAVSGSRRYVRYLAALCVGAGVMAGYASANDVTAPAAPQPATVENKPAEKTPAVSKPVDIVPLETRLVDKEAAAAAALIPAAGATEKPVAKPAAAQPAAPKKSAPVARKQPVKAPQLAPAAGGDDDMEADLYGEEEGAFDNDPLEPMNRAFFEFNRTVDGLLLRPVTQIYRGVVPEQGRTMVTHFIENLYAPVVFANSVLQADPQNSFASLWRFIINSTFGLGGMFDAASEIGLKARETDLGQTFAIYGGDAGPYFVIPLVGPSNVRDAFGRLGDAFLLPTNYMETAVSLSVYGATAVDARSNNMQLIDDIYSTSLDPYATFRSGYMQKRASDIKRAKAARDEALAKAKAQ